MLGQDDVVNTEWRKLHAKDSVETTTKKAELQKKRAMAATGDGKRYAYRQQGLGLCCGPRGKKRSTDSDDDSDDDGDDNEDSVEMSAAEEDVAAEEAEAVATQANETKSKETKSKEPSVRAACARPALHCACYSSHCRAGVRPRQRRVCGGPLPIGCRRRLPQGHATGSCGTGSGAPPLTRPYPVPTPPPLELHAL